MKIKILNNSGETEEVQTRSFKVFTDRVTGSLYLICTPSPTRAVRTYDNIVSLEVESDAPVKERCDKYQPAQYFCSRDKGHPGPCADHFKGCSVNPCTCNAILEALERGAK